MKLQILGTRGIPAQHGGFETFVEHFAIYLVKKGWEVTVYCQDEGRGNIYEDQWKGVKLIHIPVSIKGAKGTIVFDWKSTLHAASRNLPILTLGYNTAIFCLLYRFKGIKNIINMDGIEWKRKKWSPVERAWLYINEKIGAYIGNHLVADHPEIKKHLTRYVSEKKVSVIPYSADILNSADLQIIKKFGLRSNNYVLIIARPEPENSILDIVKAFSKKKRYMKLVVLGNYFPEEINYHNHVIKAASDEVLFVGAIYEKRIVQALRFFARLYIHGHTVGGTNPSLVEALGAKSAIIAHNNKYNHWVAGSTAIYFSNNDDLSSILDIVLYDNDIILKMKSGSHEQIKKKFTWEKIHNSYEKLLTNITN